MCVYGFVVGGVLLHGSVLVCFQLWATAELTTPAGEMLYLALVGAKRREKIGISFMDHT